LLIVHGNSAYFFGEKSIPPSAAGFPSTPIHDCRTYYLNSGIDVDLKYKSYLITAKAINVQTSDSECKIITLDNTGQKGGTSGQACW